MTRTHEGYEYLKKQGIHVIDDYRVCTDGRGSVGGDLPPSGRTAATSAMTSTERWSRSTVSRTGRSSGHTSKVPQMGDRLQISAGGKRDKAYWTSNCRSEGQAGSRRLRYLSRYGCVERAFRRATLHNQDFIDDLDVGIGDTIVVYKSGEIIPKVKEVRKEKRPDGLEDAL